MKTRVLCFGLSVCLAMAAFGQGGAANGVVKTQPPAEVLEILSVHCIACHISPAKKGGGFAIFKAPKEQGLIAELSAFDLLRIDQAVYSGEMPKGESKSPLSESEYATLRAWINDYYSDIKSALRSTPAPLRKSGR